MRFMLNAVWDLCSFNSNVPFLKRKFQSLANHSVIVKGLKKVKMGNQSVHLKEYPSNSQTLNDPDETSRGKYSVSQQGK